MIVRHTRKTDIDDVMSIYEKAREFMRDSGNPHQWANHYPSMELILKDIDSDSSYVLIDNDEIVACFFFSLGPDPTYSRIENGAWLNDDSYGVIHRIAVKYHGRGLFMEVLKYCSFMTKNIRIDTHSDNVPMQRALSKNGFVRCGTIYLSNGDERIAYQRIG